MKWITHETVAVGAAWLMGFPPIGLAGVFVGSILPDVLDQTLARLLLFRQQAFQRIHRGTTHWFGWWLVLLAASLPRATPFAAAPDMSLFLLGLGFGALAHVLLDMCTVMGIPLAPWTRKHMLSLNLCKTGSFQEYILLTGTLVLFAVLAREDLRTVVAMTRKHVPALPF